MPCCGKCQRYYRPGASHRHVVGAVDITTDKGPSVLELGTSACSSLHVLWLSQFRLACPATSGKWQSSGSVLCQVASDEVTNWQCRHWQLAGNSTTEDGGRTAG